jgi:SAM-dependent methyltransferase
MNNKVGKENGFTYFEELEPGLSFDHEHYAMPSKARIRREYMDLARGDFYGRVYSKANIYPYTRVLDIGCGDGSDMIKLHQLGHVGPKIGMETPVKGDPQATEDKGEHIHLNLQENGVANAKIIFGYAENIPLTSDSVDAVIAASVFPEFFDMDKAFSEIHRVLIKQGGKLVIITNGLNNKPLHHGYLEFIGNFLDAEPPVPISSPFKLEKALDIVESRRDFELTRIVRQKGPDNLTIKTEGEIDTLLASLTTYRDKFRPRYDVDWAADRKELAQEVFSERIRYDWTKALAMVEDDVRKKIKTDGAAYETIDRGGLICMAV